MTEPTYMLALHHGIGTTKYTTGQVYRIMYRHGRDLVDDDDHYTGEQFDPEVLSAADEIMLGKQVVGAAVTAPVLHAIAEIVDLGAEYAHNNDYADDPDFPDDAFADSWLRGSARWHVYWSADVIARWTFDGAADLPPNASDRIVQEAAEAAGVDEIVCVYIDKPYRRRRRVLTEGHWGEEIKVWKDVPL